jgi:hypothetical protein
MSCENNDLVKSELSQDSNGLGKELMSVLQELRIEMMNEHSKLIEIY